MNRRSSGYYKKNNSAIVPQIVCAVVFCLLTFLYFSAFQADVMALRYKSVFKSISFYNEYAVAVLAVMFLGAVAFAFIRIFRSYRNFYALPYFPSLLLLWILAEMNTCNGKSIVSLLCILLVPLGTFVSEHFFPSSYRNRIRLFFLRRTWPSVMVLSLIFFFICAFSSYGITMRYRLKVERLINVCKYDKALEVGAQSPHTDKSLSMLRIYALSRLNLLGDRLFCYPIVGKRDALLPNSEGATCLLIENTEIYSYIFLFNTLLRGSGISFEQIPYSIWKDMPVANYNICGCLLEKDIDGFVRELQRFDFTSALTQLPRHYREALILYRHIRSKHVISYHNAPMDADFEDMQALEKNSNMSEEERRSAIKDIYGNTYWYYYYYAL